MKQHHSFVIEAEAGNGIETAQAWAEKELGMKVQGNPDVVVMRYGLLTVDDARRVSELAAGKAFLGEHKIVIIAATRAYHEAQNALLKVFEEPPVGTYLFLILPTLGGLLPTLRSRVQVLRGDGKDRKQKGMIYHTSQPAKEFMKASKEKRSAIIKRLTSGKDEEERRELRDQAVAIVNGVEAAAYALMQKGDEKVVALLSDIAVLRGYFHDRSAPVRMILEHLSLVIPKGLI